MSDEPQSQQPGAELSTTPPPPEAESAPQFHQVQQVQQARPPVHRTPGAAAGIGIAGWLVPGLGHALQKMWGRAAACFLAVGILVIVGSGMRGNLFTSEGGDAFATLGYIADLGTGSFYWIAK